VVDIDPVRVRLGTLAALLVVAATAVLTSGCGASLDPVAQAATRTSGVDTLRFSMDVKLKTPTVAATIPVTVDGAIDSSAHRMRLSMDLSKAAALSGGSDSVGRMTIVEDGLMMYMSGSAFGGVLPGGKSWIGIDLSKIPSLEGFDLSALTSGPTDPRTSLAQLRKAGNVVKIGPQTIGGVPTTRYNVLVDLRQGLDKLEGAQRAAMQQVVDRLESTGGRYVPADAWIDANGYLRRFSMAIPNYFGSGTSFSLTMNLFGFGEPVNIAVPTSDQVVDLTDRLSSLGR
jgi:hypothetical protein